LDRMSARFVAKRFGFSTDLVYQMWEEMGLIIKNGTNSWKLTELGEKNGGLMSSVGYVPTFEFKVIEKLMMDFYNIVFKK